MYVYHVGDQPVQSILYDIGSGQHSGQLLSLPANHKQGKGKKGDWDYDSYDYYGEKDTKVRVVSSSVSSE